MPRIVVTQRVLYGLAACALDSGRHARPVNEKNRRQFLLA